MEPNPHPPVVAILKIEAPEAMSILVSPTCSCSELPVDDFYLKANQWLQSPGQGQQRYLSQISAGQTLRIGRSKTNDLTLTDYNVSRFHAILTASPSGVVLNDLSSTNGTFVNTRRVTTLLNLSNADQVDLGDSRITLEFCYTKQDAEFDTTQGATKIAGMKVIDVTVLLADICSYTKMSQVLPSLDVAEALQDWFKQVNQIVEHHGGGVDKYIGDCAMALWRGKGNTTDAAIAAVEAAREIFRFTTSFSQERWLHHPDYPWRCRLALNTGTALCGSLGTGEAREYTVLGDSINVTFRLESLASQLGADLILGESTAALIKDQVALLPLGKSELKGRVGEEQVYTLEL
jgi:adenylate cyclase